MPSAKSLRLLLIEDSATDAELALASLKDAGYCVSATRVESAAQLRAALPSGAWDVIVSDHQLPGFSAIEALDTLRTAGNDVPFIVCSGPIGEEVAVDLIRRGAADFVAKNSLRRLGSVIERALREAEIARQHRAAEEALQQNEPRFRALTENIPGVVFQSLCTPDDRMVMVYISDEVQALCGLAADDICRDPMQLLALIVPEDLKTYHQSRLNARYRQRRQNWEGRIRVPHTGEIKWINLRASVRELPCGDVLSEGIINNITQNKEVEIELLRSREALRELSSHLQLAKERERADIAREVHDDLGGTLTAAKIDLLSLMRKLPPAETPLLGKAGSIEILLDQAMDISRRISRRLRPGVLDYGIAAAIEWQVRDFEKRTDIQCSLACSDDDLTLTPNLSTALFRIFQETLTNISKHARARQVWIELLAADDQVKLAVSDDGRGIADQDLSKRGSFGVRGMRERAEHLGGQFQIGPRPGRGTQVEVLFPMAAIEEDSNPAYAGRLVDSTAGSSLA